MKPITDADDPTTAWAVRLWDRLQTSLLDAQNAIVAIIDAKAWEPLGYETFAKAWIDKMSDITIASELRPHVVYQMISEGLTPDQVATTVKGVGEDMAARLKEQKERGVPPEFAATRRKKAATKETPYATIFIHVPRDTAKAWRRIAKQQNTTVEAIALPALEATFNDLDAGN